MSSSRLRAATRSDDASGGRAALRRRVRRRSPIDADEIRSWLANEELAARLAAGARGRRARRRLRRHLARRTRSLELDVVAPGHWDDVLRLGRNRRHAAAASAFVRTQVPHGHALADDRRGARLPHRGAHSLHDGDRPRRAAAATSAPGRLRAAHLPRRRRGAAARARCNEAFADDPFFSDVTPGNFREFYLGGRGFDPELWLLALARRRARRVRARVSRSRRATQALGWVGNARRTAAVASARARRGAPARLRSHVLYDRGLRRVGLGVDAENVTGALRLYERVGNARQVRQVGQLESRRRERAARALSRLPHADRGRDRAGVSVPLLRARVRRRARARPARVG